MMLNYIQHMRNNKQQSLNINQQLTNHPPSPEKIPPPPIEERVPASRGQWNFLDRHSALFRKSSLLLIVTLGREYTTKFHVRDLSRSLRYDVSLVSKNLKKLENFGLVKHEDRGNLVLYQANMQSMLLRQMKIFFTLLELNELIHALEPVSTNSILYGSCAKGEDTSASDIDLFIETMDKDATRMVLTKYQDTIERTLSPVIVTTDETYAIKMKDKPFFSSIMQGIILKEGENVI